MPAEIKLKEKLAELLPRDAANHTEDLIQTTLHLESLCQIKSPLGPALPRFLTPVDPENIATQAENVRLLLHAGETPILDLVALLETQGIRVIILPLPQTLSGFSMVLPEQGVFMMVNSADTAERKIFTLAHELGHLVLHEESCSLGGVKHPGTEASSDQMEQEADSFASHFLMPKKSLLRFFHSHGLVNHELTYPLLLNMKARFGVSAEACLRRLTYLELITKRSADKLMTQIQEHYDKTNYQEPWLFGHIPQLSENTRAYNLVEIAKKTNRITSDDAKKSHSKFGF